MLWLNIAGIDRHKVRIVDWLAFSLSLSSSPSLFFSLSLFYVCLDILLLPGEGKGRDGGEIWMSNMPVVLFLSAAKCCSKHTFSDVLLKLYFSGLCVSVYSMFACSLPSCIIIAVFLFIHLLCFTTTCTYTDTRVHVNADKALVEQLEVLKNMLLYGHSAWFNISLGALCVMLWHAVEIGILTQRRDSYFELKRFLYRFFFVLFWR